MGIKQSDNFLRWSTIGLLFIAMVNAYIDRGNMSMVAPVLAEELMLTSARKGYIFSAFLFGYALTQIPAGRLVDRFGVRRSYTFFYFLWGITAALFGLANVFWHFMTLRVILGVCEAVSGPASFKFIAAHFSKSERGLASGVFLAGTKIGPAIGAVLAAYLIEAFGWRMLFVLSGLVPLLWLLPWEILMRRIENRKDAFAVFQEGPSEESVSIPLRDIFSRAKTWGIFLGYFCYGYVWYLYINWLPSYLYDSLGLSIKETGWWSAYAYGGLAIVTVLAGFIADKLISKGKEEGTVRKGFVIAGFLSGAAVIFLPFTTSHSLILGILIFAISGMGLATANTWSIMQTVAPSGTVGTFSGIQNFGATSGGALAPIIAGYLVGDTGSYGMVFVMAGMMMAVGIFSYIILIGKVEPMIFKNTKSKNNENDRIHRVGHHGETDVLEPH